MSELPSDVPQGQQPGRCGVVVDPEMRGGVGAGKGSDKRRFCGFPNKVSYPARRCLGEELRFSVRDRGTGLGEQR